MKKLVTMLLALLTLTACLAGCGAAEKTDLQYIQEKGTLIVGITDYAPMDYKDENGDWTGFDAEFAGFLVKGWASRWNSSSLPTGIRSSMSWKPRISTPSGTE